jgi:hypothetical protein
MWNLTQLTLVDRSISGTMYCISGICMILPNARGARSIDELLFNAINWYQYWSPRLLSDTETIRDKMVATIQLNYMQLQQVGTWQCFEGVIIFPFFWLGSQLPNMPFFLLFRFLLQRLCKKGSIKTHNVS